MTIEGRDTEAEAVGGEFPATLLASADEVMA